MTSDEAQEVLLDHGWNGMMCRELSDVALIAAAKSKPPILVGTDLSDGVETHVEGYWKDGVMHITEAYEIVSHKTSK